jgi:tripartite-type tricarboxylate transporter receptor subunit TctC
MIAKAARKQAHLPAVSTTLGRAVGVIATSLCCLGAQAASQVPTETWPKKPVRLVVPFGAGGMPDILARVIADKLAKKNGQPFVVDNRSGAGGNVGAGIVARANPDGYHFLMTPGSVLTMNPSLYAQVPFDADSFIPTSLVVDMALLLVVQSKNPAKDVDGLISAAKRDAGKLIFSSPGAGSGLHLAIELFQRSAGVVIQHVPYKSGGEALTAVLSGQAVGSFTTPPVAMPQIKAGTLRALAVVGSKRLSQLPDIPATSEAGLVGFDVSSWFGLVAPANTPLSIVKRLSAQTAEALHEADVQQRLVDLGVHPIGSTPEEFTRFLQQDRAKWDEIIRAAHIRLE